MKKLVLILGMFLAALPLFSQNTYKYPIYANGGIRVGENGSLIDSAKFDSDSNFIYYFNDGRTFRFPYYMNFCDEYFQVWSNFQIKPSPSIALQQNSLVRDLVSFGIWDSLDVFYLFSQNNEDNALINWVTPGTYDLTLQKSSDITFTPLEGLKGGGTNGYAKTGFNPTDADGHYSQNSGSIGIYVREGSNNGAWDMAANNPYSGIKNYSSLVMYYGLNSNSYHTDVSQATGIFAVNRTGQNVVTGYINLDSTNNADTVTSLIDYEFYMFTRNKEGSPEGAYSTDQYSCAWIGGGLTDNQIRLLMYAVEDYMDSNGKGIITDDNFTLGQMLNIEGKVLSGSYTVTNSIRIIGKKDIDFESGVTITADNTFSDELESLIVNKHRHAILRIMVDGITIDFNDAVIDCNQSTLLSGSKYMNCVMLHNVRNTSISNIIGHNTHNTVYANTSQVISVYNSTITDLGSISDDNYKNAALDIQFCDTITGSVFRGYGCEEVVDVNDGDYNVDLSNIYGENTTQAIFEINDSKHIIADSIYGLTPHSNWLVNVQKYNDVPYKNQDIKLTRMQDNSDFYESGEVADTIFVIH